MRRLGRLALPGRGTLRSTGLAYRRLPGPPSASLATRRCVARSSSAAPRYFRHSPCQPQLHSHRMRLSAILPPAPCRRCPRRSVLIKCSVIAPHPILSLVREAPAPTAPRYIGGCSRAVGCRRLNATHGPHGGAARARSGHLSERRPADAVLSPAWQRVTRRRRRKSRGRISGGNTSRCVRGALGSVSRRDRHHASPTCVRRLLRRLVSCRRLRGDRRRSRGVLDHRRCYHSAGPNPAARSQLNAIPVFPNSVRPALDTNELQPWRPHLASTGMRRFGSPVPSQSAIEGNLRG